MFKMIAKAAVHASVIMRRCTPRVSANAQYHDKPHLQICEHTSSVNYNYDMPRSAVHNQFYMMPHAVRCTSAPASECGDRGACAYYA